MATAKYGKTFNHQCFINYYNHIILDWFCFRTVNSTVRVFKCETGLCSNISTAVDCAVFGLVTKIGKYLANKHVLLNHVETKTAYHCNTQTTKFNLLQD